MTLTENQLYERVIKEVHESPNITVALNENCEYIAVNSVACDYLEMKANMLLGKSALDLYPEITASLNHRNILKALSGHSLDNQRVESRKGHILRTSYRPFSLDGTVKAIVISGKLPS
ncbi:MAG: PAS domain-containing protein [Bacteroidetes bacterium]|nr:PAS domain-containing protein [Bacteroidota bacterium]